MAVIPPGRAAIFDPPPFDHLNYNVSAQLAKRVAVLRLGLPAAAVLF
jgi:hypothetical protein